METSLEGPMKFLSISQESYQNENQNIWNGIPEFYRKSEFYFRNLKLNDLMVLTKKSEDGITPYKCHIVKKIPIQVENGKMYKEIKITGPPCRVTSPFLHAYGNYKPGDSIQHTQFSVVIYEGDITEDQGIQYADFPAIEREQKAFFDFCQEFSKIVIEEIWNHPKIMKEIKENLIAMMECQMYGRVTSSGIVQMAKEGSIGLHFLY